MESNTLEEVVNIKIAAGQSSGKIDITPEGGQIIRAKIFYSSLNNPGIVNAGINDDNGTELSKMQHIDNYKDRNSSYLDCKPFYHQGGRKLWFKISATANFAAEFNAQLILIKLDQGATCNNNQ